MCYVTNLNHQTYACKLACPKICSNTTFTWLEHARPSTKSRGIIGLTVGWSYSKNVTVNRYNGHIRRTIMIVRCLGVVLWTLILMFIKLNSLRYATHLILQQSKVVPFNPLICWVGRVCYGFNYSVSVVQMRPFGPAAHSQPWAVWDRIFGLMSIAHPSGNDLEFWDYVEMWWWRWRW